MSKVIDQKSVEPSPAFVSGAASAVSSESFTTGGPLSIGLRRRSVLAARLDSYPLLLVALSLLVLGPLLQPGYFWGAHDARHSVYFLFEFDHVFQDGVWYPRWFSEMTFGYGYPLFNIYGPLAFYAGELFHLLGADFVTAVKLVLALSWILSGLAMYGFVNRLFNSQRSAFLSGLAYVFMPYHLVDVYVRAALAESVALIFLPLTLWAFYETIMSPRPRAVLFAAFAYAGMLFAHNGVALLFSPVLGAWIIFLILKRSVAPLRSFPIVQWIRLGWPPFAGLLLGLGITGIFLLPLVAEYKFINVAQWTANYYNYQEHFVEFFQLFSPTWGFGISNPGAHDGLSFQFGAVPLILALFSLVAIFKNPRGVRPYLLFFAGLSIVVALLMFSFSLPIWQVIGLSSVAQFPWRLLTLTTVTLSILAGAVMLEDGNEPSTALSLPTITLGALVLIGSYPYITAQNSLQAAEGPVGYQGLIRFEQSANEMTGITVYAAEQPTWSSFADNVMGYVNIRSKIDFSAQPASLFILLRKNGLHTNGETFDFNAKQENTSVIFDVQNYPGWTAHLLKSRTNEIIRDLPIDIDPPYGRIKVTLPQGEYGLMLRFEDTAPRVLGQILSALSVLIAIVIFSWDVWRRGRNDRIYRNLNSNFPTA